YGYAHQGRCIEAEEIAGRAIRDEAESLDIYYVLAYVKLTLREYDAVIEASSQYVAQMNAIEKGLTKSSDIASTKRHASQLYNFLATAFKEQGKTAEAAEAYERSIALDPGNSLPYLNLANQLVARRDTVRARDIVKRGLSNCRQVQELRMINETLSNTATVSACMIVKNEEDMLPDCLASIRDWVDEIILVDTGSTDRTVDIAQRYGCKIFHQEWEGNFAKHRNYSLEQATGDWIFIIDADERFVAEDVKVIRPLLNADEFSCLSINVYNVYKGSEERTTFLPSIRLWRRKLNLRYEGIVHNTLQVPPHVQTHRAAARIRHLGYDLSEEKMAQKARRTSSLLEKQLEENPNNAFALFNYAQLLAGRRQNDMTAHADRILEMADRAVRLTGPKDRKTRHIHLMCLNHLAWTSFFIDRLHDATLYADQALAAKADYLDPLLLKGHIAAKANRMDEARAAYQQYLDVQSRYDASQETDNMIISHVDSRVNAHYGLAMIAELSSQTDEAKRQYRRVLELDPEYLEANGSLGRILLAEGDVEAARLHFERQTQTGVYSRASWFGLGKIAASKQAYAEAEQCYRQVLQINPDDREASTRLAEVLERQGNTREAASWVKKAGATDTEDNQSRIDTAASLFALGQYQEAADAYRSLADENKTSELLNDLGNCCFKLGEYDQAVHYYQEAIDIQPVAAAAYRNLGVAYLQVQKPEAAVEALLQYVAVDPEAEDVIRTAADIQMSLQRYTEALSLYERYLAKHPRAVDILFRLSECYLHMGHEDSAILGYRRILEIDPAHKPAQERLGSLSQPVARA
ncbi:tetratricopeptide repeat protein, partial [candidate division GN15 bacterium]|nr:tetratricopeptide repeat protein [candidate division GN15 bacterium]